MATLAARQLSRQAFEATPWLAIPESRRWLAGIVLAVSNFMVVLDMTIANVSVPHIAGSLAVSPSQGTWVITSYAVAEAIIVPLTGWLTARVGTVRLFLLSIVGFALASLLCAWSTSLGMLIAARIVQGLCGGPIMPLSQTLLLSSYPPGKTGPALAAWAMTTLLAPIAGPVLGGWISDNLAWQWIFYINLPVGLLCTTLVYGIYARRETRLIRAPIDRVGLVLLVVWVGALQLILDKGQEADWFAADWVRWFSLISVMSFLGFIATVIPALILTGSAGLLNTGAKTIKAEMRVAISTSPRIW